MVAPVMCASRLYGLICAADPSRSANFTVDELSALELLADQVGAGLHAVLSARLLAGTDPITRLHNRRSFDERVAGEVEQGAAVWTPALAAADRGRQHQAAAG